jgi:hypothetical protein
MTTDQALRLATLILQAIASFAIAGGLIFTAVQFRQARRAQHVANFARLVEMQNQLRRMRIEDPALAAVYKDDVRDLHSPEEIRAYFLNLMQLAIFEIAWYAHKHGQLADDYYESWVNRMRVIEQEESFQRMFNSPNMKILHEDFHTLMERIMKESGNGTSR